MWALIAISMAVLVFCLVSGRTERSVITPPMVFTLVGLLVGVAGLGLMELPITHGSIHVLAEITLVLVLFSDAARIDLRQLLADHDLPQRMLLVGMPLTVALGTLIAWQLPLGLTLIEAALLASVLAPTDAALGQSVVSNKAVPVRIRQALNVESGLNDGIAVPLVYVFAGLLVMGVHAQDPTELASFTASQLILGPLAGIAVGAAMGILGRRAGLTGWMSEAFEGPAVLATAALSYGLAHVLHGNGFIAAFTAGLLFGYFLQGQCKFILEFAESEGQVLVLLAFLAFGALLVPQVIEHFEPMMLVYAVLSLTVIRMLPIAISLMGKGLSTTSVLFLGWFGPRGLASILFALLVVEQLKTPGAEMILGTTIVTVALSILLHGLTAAPLAQWYADLTRRSGECPENHPVPEMPTRH